MVVTLPIAYLADAGLREVEKGFFAWIPGVAVGLIARSFGREWVDVDDGPQDLKFQRRFRKWAWIFAAVTFCLISFDVWTCPHGTGLKFGPCVLTHTGPEGMCRHHIQFDHRHELTKRWSFYLVGM